MSQSIEKMLDLSPRAWAAVVIALSVVFFLALNVFSNVNFRSARLDLTENGAFSISQGTVNTLRTLKEPIRMRFFYSRKLGVDYPQVRGYADRVQNLLEEYAARSRGKLKLEVIDPEPFTEAEDMANAYGLRGAQTQTGEMLYFGLVGTNAIDGQEVVPFFAQEREPHLEYDLTEIVYKLNNPEKPTLGIISSLPLATGPGGPMAMMQGQSRPYLIYEQLAERFEISNLAEGFTEIPADVDVLMVAHPPTLSADALYAIDQFVMKGGKVLAFVDPQSDLGSQPQPGPMGQPMPGGTPESDLGPLLESWGIGFEKGKVVGDLPYALAVAAEMGGRRVRTSYPVWLGLTGEAINTKDLVTADIKQINVATAGHLIRTQNATTEFTSLIKTTGESMLYERADVTGQPDPETLLRKFLPTMDNYVIAARATGAANSAFPEGKPKADPIEGEEPKLEAEIPVHIAESQGPINVIVVADSDIFDDRFWVTEQNLFGQRLAIPTADNGNFVLNAVENLTGSNDLISLRSRSSGERPFTVVEDLRRKAESRYLRQEQELQTQLEQAEQELARLQGSGEGQTAGAFLSPEEQALVERVRAQMIETRKELRNVQRSLRSDIEALGNRLAFLNIAFVPLIVVAFAIWLAMTRRKRRTQRIATGG